MNKFSYFLLVLITICLSCQSNSHEDTPPSPYASLTLPERPNILWLVAEDLSPFIPSFGDSTIQTPNLSRLAAEGVCYDNVYSPSGVCAPSRAALITGMYPNSIAAGHMRTGPWYNDSLDSAKFVSYRIASPPNIPPYEAVPPPEVKMFTEYLRAAGYYCSNNAKEDYQFRKTMTAWDESSNKAHWRNRAEGQPFFSVFNFGITHESQIWSRADDSLWVEKDLEVPVPPYLPDTEVGRTDIRRMYSNIKIMDHQVGEVLRELEEDGLLESTIVVWYTDHGGPLPRMKRLCYDSGLKAPMIIRFPNKQLAGQRDDQLISFVDFAPTTLSLANIESYDYFDGQAFLGDFRAEKQREYIHAAADRFDEKYDKIRAVRDHRFKYMKYYDTDKPMLLAVGYREQMPIMQELRRLKEAGMLNEYQEQWFRETKPPEELFDVQNDPHELQNIANDPEYADKLQELRLENERWVKEISDTGLVPEEDLVERIWPGGERPVTADPVIKIQGNTVTITSGTEGASIGYKIFEDGEPDNWSIYAGPFELPPGANLKAKAHRIGYLPSEDVVL